MREGDLWHVDVEETSSWSFVVHGAEAEGDPCKIEIVLTIYTIKM